MADINHRIALVTGANKGIGLQIARQLAEAGALVLLGARDADRGNTAVGGLASQGLKVSFIQLDICDAASAAAAAARIEAEHGRLDILVNNAGIVVKGDGAPSAAPLEIVRQSLETNFIGAMAVTQAMLPLLRKSTAGRIINISSSLGSLTLNDESRGRMPRLAPRNLGCSESRSKGMRCPGSLTSIVASRWSKSSALLGNATSSSHTDARTSSSVVPANGGTPTSISYPTQPSAQTSMHDAAGCCANTSGEA